MDDELVSTFLDEGAELLDHIEPTLMEIQQAIKDRVKPDNEQINELFRLYHTFRGSAGILGLERVTNVTHHAESLLDLVRHDKLDLTAEGIDLLCRAIDLIRELLETFSNNNNDEGHDDAVEAMVAELMAAAEPETGQQTAYTVETTPQPVTANTQEDDAIDPLRQRFLAESEDLLESMEHALVLALKKPNDSDDEIQETFRSMHTLKGNSAIMELSEIEQLTQQAESVLDTLRSKTATKPSRSIEDLLTIIDVLRGAIGEYSAGGDGSVTGLEAFIDVLGEHLESAPKPEEVQSTQEAFKLLNKDQKPGQQSPSESKNKRTISEVFKDKGGQKTTTENKRQDVRVDLAKLDALINSVGELVLAESMVANNPVIAECEDETLQSAIHHLRRVASDLQDIAMAARMIPLAGTFKKMMRVVHDVAKRCGKDARLELVGEETEVDKTVIEKIGDPLVHIVRNALDHGLETPEERLAVGKPEQGTVTIEARHEAGEVWILIKDDGKGINREAVLKKAYDKGIVGPEAVDWPDEKVNNLIFAPGFSTAAAITDVSGRGVGMDVVKRNIENLKGRVDILSEFGKGSTIRLRLPLTLAIINGLVIRVGTGRYIIPILNVHEAFQANPEKIIVGPDGDKMIRIREDIHHVIHLGEVLNRPADNNELENGLLVIVEVDKRRVCLMVDEVLGQQETVIKGLSSYLGDARGIAGCTILGDGSVALILDPPGVLHLASALSEQTVP